MTPILLFRSDLDTEGEAETASRYMNVVPYRSQIPSNSLVIGRYSVLPFYRELERELALQQSKLINSYVQHSFIADVMEWGSDQGCLAGLTPRSWTDWYRLPEGAYVVKGKTNSRKQKWATHMFAPTVAHVPVVAQRLMDDALINDQGIVVREYIPLRQMSTGINGLPVTNEWRTFWYVRHGEAHLLAKGFYWLSHPEVFEQAQWTDAAMSTALEAAQRISPHANFFVLDLAETADGRWIVIEVNDGQMSGLSCVSPDDLYSNLSRLV